MSNDKKTILMVTPYFPPAGGGLERYAFEIATRLISGNWKVVVVTSGERHGIDIKEEVHGITVYRLSYGIKISNTPFSFGWISKIRRILKKENPDIINIHTPVPGIGDIAAALTRKKPVVVTYHAGSMHKGRALYDIFIWLYEHGPMHYLLKHADHIVCSSDFVRLNFLRKYQYKSTTITPAVDCNYFYPDRTKKSVRPTVLFVGGISKSEQHKGLLTLIGVVKKMREKFPDILLEVVGTGNMRSKYESFVERQGLQSSVVFCGRLDGQGLVSSYQRAHVFAMPSTNESFGMAVIEAMACELPVVTTRVGVMSSIVESGVTGFLVPSGDSMELEDKLSKILGNLEIARRFGESGRQRVITKFSWQKSAEMFRHVLENYGDFVGNPKHICVVTPYFNPRVGGMEMYAHNLSKRLNSIGKYRISIITSNDLGGGYSQDVIDGMIVHRLPISFVVSNTPIGISWYWWIKKIFIATRPDLIHLHTPVAYIADVAALAAGNTPVVVTYHSGSMLKGKWPIDLIIWAYEHFFLPRLLERANAIVAVYEQFLRKNFAKFENKIIFIPVGVDLKRFAPVKNKPKGQIITYIGRIERTSAWKGINYLIEAMVIIHKHLPQVRLELVGGGDALLDYKAYAKKRGIENYVDFRGSQVGSAVVDAHHRSSVLVLPSISDSEAFPTVLVEAMATGTPIVASNIGGIPNVFNDNIEGFLVKPKDSQILATAIVRILKDRVLAGRLGYAGLQRSKEFSWENQVHKYEFLFSKILKSSRW